MGRQAQAPCSRLKPLRHTPAVVLTLGVLLVLVTAAFVFDSPVSRWLVGKSGTANNERGECVPGEVGTHVALGFTVLIGGVSLCLISLLLYKRRASDVLLADELEARRRTTYREVCDTLVDRLFQAETRMERLSQSMDDHLQLLCAMQEPEDDRPEENTRG